MIDQKDITEDEKLLKIRRKIESEKKKLIKIQISVKKQKDLNFQLL